jgi:hypothetical protein
VGEEDGEGVGRRVSRCEGMDVCFTVGLRVAPGRVGVSVGLGVRFDGKGV